MTRDHTLPVMSTVVLVVVLSFLIMRKLNEKFEEYFGSSCVDLIEFSRTPQIPIKKGTIFVSIASYRDTECGNTVNSIFSSAKNPENIFLGICEQNKDGSEDEVCYKPDSILKDFDVSKYINQIRYHNLPYTSAKGPTYARYHCSKLWSGEEFYLQIDSHTTFEKDWDYKLIKMLDQCRYSDTESDKHPYGIQGSKKPILSAYPPTFEQVSLPGFPVMDNAKISDGTGLPIFLAGIWNIESDKPLKSPKPFIAAGLMFLDSTFLYDVQYDPNLSHLFQGEETLFSARLFTNGYDVFAPNLKVCSHHYNRSGPMFYKDNVVSYECRAKAEKKVLFLIGLSEKETVMDDFIRDIDRYGLGTFRTMDNFWHSSGITITNKKLVSVENWSVLNKPSEPFEGWDFYISGFLKIRQFI